MLIQNLSNEKIMIRHETVIDSDSLFMATLVNMLSTIPDSYECKNHKNNDQILFDEFLKRKIKDIEIAVQVFEIIDKSTSFAEYFAPEAIWENRKVWDDWSENFKINHKMFIYFYKPENNKQEIFSGSIHMNFTTQICFSKNNKDMNEYFEMNSEDYSINHNDMTGTFEIELFSDAVWKYLQRSNHLECQNLIKEFICEKLKVQLPESENKAISHKI